MQNERYSHWYTFGLGVFVGLILMTLWSAGQTEQRAERAKADMSAPIIE